MSRPPPSPLLHALMVEALADAQFVLSPDQVALVVAHAQLLLEWNDVAGLTRLVSPAEIVRRHFIESFLAASLLPQAPAGGALRVLDIGSGGGFPGLAMRVTRPELQVTLLEPRGKKAAFLRAAARLYPPPLADVRSCRLDELASDAPWPAVTFRGVRFDMADLLRLTAPGATIVTLAGEGPESIAADLASAGLNAGPQVAIPGRLGKATAWRRPD